jgi:hypothetical protein
MSSLRYVDALGRLNAGFGPRLLSRRDLLSHAHGFGALAFSVMLAEATAAPPAVRTRQSSGDEETPKAIAKHVILLFMDGGPSQVDTFDPKPRLSRESGQPITQQAPKGQFESRGVLLGSPWKFRRHGKSGIPVSELFPEVAKCVDRMAIVRSTVSDFAEHTSANFILHTGHGRAGRPSMGAWIAYGLGNENGNLPDFIVLEAGSMPPGGMACFANGFLPASCSGSILHQGGATLRRIAPAERSIEHQRAKLVLRDALDSHRAKLDPLQTPEIEAAIRKYELAASMQASVPELLDFHDETSATLEMYGINETKTAAFARECLLARRMIERGVRFIELVSPRVRGDRWDQHVHLREGHEDNAIATDKPIAALLRDLELRGLLDETLVIWAGEFGRTPTAHGTDGRDHNPHGFTVWMAGGGIKGGTVYGATDDYGYFAVENKVDIHDLHATILYLLGVDHTKLTYLFGGREMRLTDVYGNVIHEIIA